MSLQDDANNPNLIETARGRGYRFIGELTKIRLDPDVDKPSGVNIPFVGRATELSVMQARLDVVVREAKCQLVLIQGEAGIGKTRLLTEFITSVRPEISGYIATSPGFDGAPAFWPWTEILREALADQKSQNSQLTENARALSSVFPEILETTETQSDAIDRFSVLSLWARAIRSISNGRPLLLAFEDIHRADIDTLSLLARICSELCNDPVLIIATRRPRASTDRGATILGELSGLPASTNIDVDPLTASQIAAMLDPLIDDRQSLGEALRYRTSGNAFYATSLIRLLGRTAIARSTNDLVSTLPFNSHEIVERQLSDLPQPTRRALSVASVIGVRFAISLVAKAGASPMEELIQDLDAAKRACVIAENGPNFAFTHSLLRESLYLTLDSLERRKLHLAVANALQQSSSPNSRTPEIAEHLLRALPLSDVSRTCLVAINAGNQSAARFAYSKAQFFFKIALGLAENDSILSSGKKCELMLSLAESELYDGDRDGAYSTLQEAAFLARAVEDPMLFASCALQLAPDFLSIEIGTCDTKLISMLRQSLDLLPDHAISLRSQVLARLSLALLWSEDARDSEIISIEALRVARLSRDSTALGAALAARADSLHGPDRAIERMQVISELHKTVRTRNSLSDTMMQLIRTVSTHLELGNFRELDSAITASEKISAEMNVPQYLWYPLAFKAMRQIMRGNFSAAADLGRRFRQLGESKGDANVRNSHSAQTGCILIEKNQAALALPTISEMAINYPLVRAWRAGTGYLYLSSSDPTEARRVLNSFDDRDIDLLSHEAGGCAGVAFLAGIAASTGDSKQQRLLYDLCCRAPDHGAVVGFGIAYFGCFHKYAGNLAWKLGLVSESLEHLRSAIDIENRCGAVVLGAHASLDLATILIETSGACSEVEALFRSVCGVTETVESELLSHRLSELWDSPLIDIH